jgi:3-isopropylmalate/(R)-2-methylmalate dehydratase small subunit
MKADHTEMKPFIVHRGKIAVLDWTDVNTDLIIPARYLKRIERVGYGPLLFADKKYVPGGAPAIDDPESHGALNAEFPLNRADYQDATVLLVGKNFGCGSSREHAVWAIAQAGYRVLIAPGKNEGFADIFEGNSLNNGLLVIEVPEEDWKRLADAGSTGGVEATVDLKTQTIVVHDGGEPEFKLAFEVPETQRQRLLQGLDAISETLQYESDIARYEQAAPGWLNAVST